MRGVGEVLAVFLQNVSQPEAEFDFWDEFEERKVEVASDSRFKHEVEGFGAQERVFVGRQVVHRRESCHNVGPIVVEARRTHFEVYGQCHVGRLHVLRVASFVGQIAEAYVLAAEVERGDEAQGERRIEFPFAEHADRKPEIVAVVGGNPLCSRCGVDETVVGQRESLVVQADGESVMEAALINKRFVLHLALLGTDRQAAARKEQQRHNAADARKEFQMVVHRQWGRVGLREGGLVMVPLLS